MTAFNGRAITGEVNRYTEGLKEQAEPSRFLEALDSLLDTPGVLVVRWRQYTPYFNDGDPCVFHAYGAEVAVAGDIGDEDWESSYGSYAEPGEKRFRDEYDFFDYSKGYNTRTLVSIPGVDVAKVQKSLQEFENILEDGSHYVVLQEKFGDPAEVTASKDGFHVEFYEHD